MLSKLLPLIMGLVGAGAGVGTGMMLPGGGSHAGPEVAAPHGAAADSSHSGGHGESSASQEYVKLANQFVVPIIEDQDVVSLVVLSLSLEVEPGSTESVYAVEPKLRDGFLQVLFDHANMGGFGATFTDAEMLAVLRAALRDVAQKSLGDIVKEVLILDMVRQDV